MNKENQSNIRVGCIGAAAIIIAAIISLGVPFAERLAANYFPPPTAAISTPVQNDPVNPIATQPLPISTSTYLPEVIWQDLGIFYATGDTTIGNSDKWIVFQVWDGINTSTTVHGIIEPGWFLNIPAPIQGTTWMVSGYSNDYIVNRVLQMREEVVQRNNIAVPPVIYIGDGSAPNEFTTQLPSGWKTTR